MSTAIVKQAAGIPALAMDESQLITVLENSLYPGANTASIALVINYCRASQLDPMQKPVHIVPMWDSKAERMRDVIMPGIGLYRTQAARTGQCAGITEPEFGPDVTETIGGVEITYPAWCRVTVKRLLANGATAEFTAMERWKENYAVKAGKDKSIAPNKMWCKRPYGQLDKCAQAQALRKAFPELGAAPTADEMEGRSLDDFGATIDNATGEILKPAMPKATTTVQAYPQDAFEKNLPSWRKLINEGKKTADQIIAIVQTKGMLSAKQVAAIKASDSTAGSSAQTSNGGAGAAASNPEKWEPSADELAEIEARERAEGAQ